MKLETPTTDSSNLPLSADKILPRLDAIDVLRGLVMVMVVMVVLLYPACRWFADLKKRRKEVWLSYL